MLRRAAPLLALLLAAPIQAAPVDSLGVAEILRANSPFARGLVRPLQE